MYTSNLAVENYSVTTVKWWLKVQTATKAEGGAE